MQSQESSSKYSLRLLAAAVPVALLVACGGGGGATDAGTAGTTDTPGTTTATTTVVGTAASGAPLASAAVTVKCTGSADKTGTTAADGTFSVTTTGCAAPLAIRVAGTNQTLVAVAAAMNASGATRVNVTPVSNAVASTVVGGDASLAVTDYANQKAKFTAATLTERNNYFKALLATMLTSAAAPAGFDPASTQFAADGSGFDKVLDNLQMVAHGTSVDIQNKGATVATGGNAAITTVSGTTNFAGTPTALPAISADSTAAATGLVGIQTKLQGCLSLAANVRDAGGAAGYNAKCAALNDATVDSAAFFAIAPQLAAAPYPAYQNNGVNDLRPTLVDSDKMGIGPATLGKAVITRVETGAAAGTGRVFATFPVTRSDNTVTELPVVVQLINNKWLIVGNGLAGEMTVRASAKRTMNFAGASATATAGTPTAFLDIGLGIAPAVGTTVTVTGPGLPQAGVTLYPNAAGGCWTQTVAANDCNTWVTPVAGDLTRDPVQPGKTYTFTPSAGAASKVILEGGYLPTATELSDVQWATLTSATLANFNSATGYTGQVIAVPTGTATNWTMSTTGESAKPFGATIYTGIYKSVGVVQSGGLTARWPAIAPAIAKATNVTVTTEAKTASGLRVYSENVWDAQ